MRRTTLPVILVVFVAMMGLSPGVSGAPSSKTTKKSSGSGLEMYRATVESAEVKGLVQGGLDVASVEQTDDGAEVGLVLDSQERDQLRSEGVDLTVWRDSKGRTQSQRFALQAEEGFEVWDDYDNEGGIEDQIRKIARRNRGITKLVKLGETHQGRDILAIRLTQGARGIPNGKRPAVLYQGTTHAREWISTEVPLRLLEWFIKRHGSKNKMVRKLLRTTELWFVPVVNPDGYQYTFDEERLWRKNLRDNNDNEEVDGSDGVDLNRNYPEHWNYDEEGSSSEFSSAVY